jgi:hypothetical protein
MTHQNEVQISVNQIVHILRAKAYCRSSMEKYDRDKRIHEEVRENHKLAGALDPLLATLSHFTSPVHFKSQVGVLFDLWDVDGTDSLEYKEVEVGPLLLLPCY